MWISDLDLYLSIYYFNSNFVARTLFTSVAKEYGAIAPGPTVPTPMIHIVNTQTGSLHVQLVCVGLAQARPSNVCHLLSIAS